MSFQASLFSPTLSSSPTLPSPNSTELTIDPYLYAPLLFESSESGDSPPSLPSSSPATRRPRTSWVFKHMPAEDPETIYLNKYMKTEWRCKYCSCSYATNGGNLAIKKHLLVKHGKTENSSRDNITAKRQQSIEDALELSESQSFKRRKLNTCGSTGQSISGGHLEVLHVKFITACHLPLRLVECPEFRDLLNYINNDIDTWLPASHTTITEWVLRQFSAMKESMKSRLQRARTDIHLTCDLWTSPNCLPILGVIAQYITEDGKLETTTLALVDIQGAHTGENLSKYIQDVIEDWGIALKLGFMQMDNASNNDTLIEELEARKSSIEIILIFILIFIGLFNDFGIEYCATDNRIRCMGHIINLSAQSFLFINQADALDESKSDSESPITLSDMEKYRKLGPLGKLHNFVVYIGRTPQRKQQWKLISRGKLISRDNGTRWNSWEKMLREAIPLQKCIDRYFDQYSDEYLCKDRLSDEDWVNLTKVNSIVKLYK